MSERQVIEGARQLDREEREETLLDAQSRKLLPVVLAHPNDYDIDVDLLDNGHILHFLNGVFADKDWHLKPHVIAAHLEKLYSEYVKLAEKAAAKEAALEIYANREMRGYEG